jgi:TonB family protein
MRSFYMATTDRSKNETFGLLPVEKRSFKSLGISALINIAIAAIILIVSMSAVHVVQQNKLVANNVIYQPPKPKPVIPPPPHIHIPPPPRTQPTKIFMPTPKPVKPPPKVKPMKAPTPALPKMAAAPAIKVVRPKPKVGLFNNDTPKAARRPPHPSVHTGGFGDPQGVHPNPNANRKTHLVAFGSPENAPGNRKGAGRVQKVSFGSGVANGSRHGHGQVATAGFNNGAVGGSGHGHGTIAKASFGGSMYGSSGSHTPRQQKPNTTPIVVIWKPLPKYTQEALKQHVQGDVTLRVRFSASGQVRVLSVVHGLGYGLDNQAKIAAEKIRFKPATRDGHAIDAVRIIRITFQMT